MNKVKRKKGILSEGRAISTLPFFHFLYGHSFFPKSSKLKVSLR